MHQDHETRSAAENTANAGQAERRRMLLKSLGKGSAVLAAAVPIKSLATTVLTADLHLCTVSGAMSGVRSVTAGLPSCGGKSVTYYTAVGTWPIDVNSQEFINNGTSAFLRSAATFQGLFGAGGSTATMATLFTTVTDETHWVVALLNAQINGVNFPYTPAQVVQLYNDPLQQANAIAFFKTHMEQLP